jgi:hypothetical protein
MAVINSVLIVFIILILLYLCMKCQSADIEPFTTTCPAGQYSSGSNCAPCPAGSISNMGSTSINDCVCTDPILLMDGKKQECVPCPAGKYINDSGDTCLKCPMGMSSNEGSQSVQDCICPAGSESINGICHQCKKGYYKPTLGNSACIKCPYNSYVDYEGAVESTECKCLARSYYNMNTKSCLPCPRGTSSFDDWTTCKACVDNKLNGQSCDCPVGKYWTSTGYCINCPDNYYNDSVNTTQCVACPSGQGSMSGSACVPCPAGSTSTMLNSVNGFVNSGCLCNKGSYMSNGKCTTCPTGKTTRIAGAVSINDCY